MAYLTIPDDKIILYFQILHLPTPFLFVFFTHFSLLFVDRIKEYRNFLIASYIVSALLLLAILSPFFITGVQQISGVGLWPTPGLGFLFFVFYYFLSLLFPLYLLLKFYFRSTGHKRAQARFITLGIILGLIGLAPSLFYWYGYYIPPFGFILVTVWILMVAYSIIAHRFLNIKLVLRESSVYILSLSLTVLIMAVLRSVFYNAASPLNIFDIIIFVVGLLIFIPLKDNAYKIANKYFFTSLYDPGQLVSSLSKGLSSTLDTNEINNHIYKVLSSNLKLKSIAILDHDKEEETYTISYNRNIRQGKIKKIAIDKNLHHRYILDGKTVVFDELYRDGIEYSKSILDIYKKLNICALVPLLLKDKLIGILAIGHKESKDNFNNDDINVLNISGSIIATSLSNAYLYKKTEEKSKNLEELLAMKSEFLRIINHQMNTPLSIIKIGFDSLQNKIMPRKESMKTIAEGITQMENFLFEYWDAYEFEGKRRKTNLEKLDLKKIVEKEVKKIKNWKVFKNKKLKIKVEKFENNKLVIGDKKFVEHVIANILENSTYYTSKGGVNVSFKMIHKKTKPFLKVLFADTGIGIKDKKSLGLFKKFHRSSDASLYHPDGGGLSLYISSKIMEANNGELRLESTTVDKGSVFSISLPLVND